MQPRHVAEYTDSTVVAVNNIGMPHVVDELGFLETRRYVDEKFFGNDVFVPLLVKPPLGPASSARAAWQISWTSSCWHVDVASQWSSRRLIEPAMYGRLDCVMPDLSTPKYSTSSLLTYIGLLESALSDAQVVLGTNPASQLHRCAQEKLDKRLFEIRRYRPVLHGYQLRPVD